MSTVDIRGLDKAEVLAALYNATVPLRMGCLDPKSGMSMTTEEAQDWINDNMTWLTEGGYDPIRALNLDYVQGRPIKANIAGDSFNPKGLDEEAGEGTAAAAIKALRAESVVDFMSDSDYEVPHNEHY
jgi:hypothetical protein